ncbi:MAG: hypothetical protein ACLTZI_04735 [[Eubacterium] siraeum]
MKIISDSTPLIDGYRMPAEFSSHSGCIIIFPSGRIRGSTAE